MKTSHCTTAKFPWIKRLTNYFCIIVVLCFFNLVAIKAQDPNNLTTNTQPAITIVIPEEPETETELESELKERDRQNYLQYLQYILQKMSNVSKLIHDDSMAKLRKIG